MSLKPLTFCISPRIRSSSLYSKGLLRPFCLWQLRLLGSLEA